MSFQKYTQILIQPYTTASLEYSKDVIYEYLMKIENYLLCDIVLFFK